MTQMFLAKPDLLRLSCQWCSDLAANNDATTTNNQQPTIINDNKVSKIKRGQQGPKADNNKYYDDIHIICTYRMQQMTTSMPEHSPRPLCPIMAANIG